MIEDEKARSKALTTHEHVNLWMQSLTKSSELMLALQNISQSQNSSKDVSEKEKSVSKELSKPSSQNVVVSCESSSSQIVLSQPTRSKKTSDWFDKNDFQNIISVEDGFTILIHSKLFQNFSPKAGFSNLGI